jgi:hypothetical protein
MSEVLFDNFRSFFNNIRFRSVVLRIEQNERQVLEDTPQIFTFQRRKSPCEKFSVSQGIFPFVRIMSPNDIDFIKRFKGRNIDLKREKFGAEKRGEMPQKVLSEYVNHGLFYGHGSCLFDILAHIKFVILFIVF